MNTTEQKEKNLSTEEILTEKLDWLLKTLSDSQTTAYNSTTLLIELSKFLEKWHETCEEVNTKHQKLSQEIILIRELLISTEVKQSRLDEKLEILLKIIANQSEQLTQINQVLKSMELNNSYHQSSQQVNQKTSSDSDLVPLPIDAYKGFF
ncbi:hypothetical protein PI95_004475 [Hassallia byssoidea VB512170]|uniref:Uncharacterized protein n=1 Tax=Hassallia byssoidea VB512170 TaxID=1304833 RepID=A0A846H5I7_9CYAN|nr:hypothetical protein [Hassalia byssoidea]NEU71849.1 hypothetical protein [Hassalia byssoidea VB512170]